MVLGRKNFFFLMMSSQQQKVLGSPLMAMKNELLHGAVVRGELPTVRRLLDRHRADINTRNSKGLSSLQLAILNGHTKLGEFLIQKGVDIHMADPEGYTALHDAAVMENTVLVRKLISKGLSPILTTARGELVIDVAGSLHMEKLLCEEMCLSGDINLAREYYVYLGLGTHDTGRSLISYGGHSHPPRTHPKHQGPVGCKSSLGAHSPSPKSEARKMLIVQSDCQVSRNVPTHASRVHPSAKFANSSQIHPAAVTDPKSASALKLGSLPSSISDSTGNHRNAVGVSEHYKEQVHHTEGTESASSSQTGEVKVAAVATEKPGSNRLLSPPSSPPTTVAATSLAETQNHQDLKPTGKLQLSPTACESNQTSTTKSNLSPQQVRAAAAIKALQQHNSFQLQIGLSLQAPQFSSFDEEEEYFAADCDSDDQLQLSSSLPVSSSSKLSLSSSPRPVNRSRSIQPDWFLTGGQQQQHRQRPTNSPRSRRSTRPLAKAVSFADLPMTRNKPMFVGEASSDQGSTATSATPASSSVKKERRSNSVGHSLTFSTSVLDRYISNYNPTRVKEGVDETDSMFDAGIRALQLKPRKSSIMQRHNSDGGLGLRRRSVTFQPEVLLQEIVTAGDVKAVSEILESGMIEDVNKMSPSGLTALHQSAIDGNLECAKTLVGKGANVNCMDCEKWTPLHAAVMNGSVQFVRFLIASGANPNLKNDSGETAYDMSKSGPIRKMLLNAMNGRSPDADEYSDGEYSGEEEEEYSHAESESDDELEGEDSGLFDSNVGEKTSLKERLGLTHTTSVLNNSVHSNSITPSPDLDNVFSGAGQIYHRREHDLTDSTSSYGSLFETSEDKLKEMDKNYSRTSPTTTTTTTTKISNTESDTDKISESGISTMEGSSDGSHRSRVLSSEDEAITMDSDLEPDSLEYEFQEACLFCDVDRVMKLVKCKLDIDINRVNKASGITALHHCVLEENYALVQHLVRDFDADIHVQDIEGWTPLHAASAVGSIQIAQFLLDRGAKPSSLNLSCEFPVDVAEDEAMEKLLKKAMLGHSSENGLKR